MDVSMPKVLHSAALLSLCFMLVLAAVIAADAQTETVLYSFCSNYPNCTVVEPTSNLTSDSSGVLYGTTKFGGLYGAGSVYALYPIGGGAYSEATLYSFTGGTDGWGGNPSSILELSDVIFDEAGNLYGTMNYGGEYGGGVVFELSPDGVGGWTETVLHSFGGPGDAAGPALAGLTPDAAGNLYGIVWTGPYGTGFYVYELTPSGAGWTESLIASMSAYTDGGLTIDTKGNLYGVTYSAAYPSGCSCVFEVSPNGSGGWNITSVHNFPEYPSTKDGTSAYGVPVFDQAGSLYGTTVYGGNKNAGTVYRLTPVLKGKKVTWKEKILYSFKGGKKDGGNPYGGIALDAARSIYGTTSGGENPACPATGLYGVGGCGTVFELAPNPVKAGSYTEKVLWSFNGTDGESPYAGVVRDSAGNLYGATPFGGPGNACNGFGCSGLVFEVTP